MHSVPLRENRALHLEWAADPSADPFIARRIAASDSALQYLQSS
jgi:hypothetical protein